MLLADLLGTATAFWICNTARSLSFLIGEYLTGRIWGANYSVVIDQ